MPITMLHRWLLRSSGSAPGGAECGLADHRLHRDVNGMTPLTVACLVGNESVAGALVAEVATFGSQTREDGPAAAAFGSGRTCGPPETAKPEAAVAALAGAALDGQSSGGMTALMFAAAKGMTSTVRRKGSL